MNSTWDFYADAKGKWRWRRTTSSGRIIGASAQTYSNQTDCIDNARRNGYTDGNQSKSSASAHAKKPE